MILIFLLNYLLLVKLGNYGCVPCAVAIVVGGSCRALGGTLGFLCALSLWSHVTLCETGGCGNETAASCGENEMSMLLHEVQRLPENKDITENCRQVTNGSVWHSQDMFHLCTLHRLCSEKLVL